ncbi:hypothetical protein SteCoe_17055 [Stentor coeruleus]|uniref:MD-2-related lipid-recognition domain-containing protein n=1 Tax=Stentor coeruleus TaxID=5963 RepID=A0A1R2C002_9CILI|nr:hypothetical protein SteCoe_17055 [Stentor coeruleus]
MVIMKLIFVVLFACALATQVDTIDYLSQTSLGQTCKKDSVFAVNNFQVSPWPVTPAVQMQISMAGTFDKESYIACIEVRTKFNGGKWVYKYFDVGQNFPYGAAYTFTAAISSGTAAGEYTEEVSLQKKQGDSVSCWTYTYHI